MEHRQLPESRQPDRTNERYVSKHFTIMLEDEVVLLKKLQRYEGTQTYLESNDKSTLPSPVDEVALESYFDGSIDQVKLESYIYFPPATLQDNPGFDWQADLSNTIQQVITKQSGGHFELDQLDHDAHSIYIALDAEIAARIGFDPTSDRCRIVISSESIAEINHATGQSLAKKDLPVKRDALIRLYDMADLTGICIDVLIAHYGNRASHSKPHIIAPRAYPIENETSEKTSEEVINEPEQEVYQRTLDDIGGAFMAKQKLQEISHIINHQDVAALYDVSGSHFILHGPPGTGKTSLVEAFAHDINATLVTVKSSHIIGKFVGESAKNLDEIFNAAKAASGKIVIGFEEFDTLASGGQGGTQERVDVRKNLGLLLDDISRKHPNIIIAATTNADIDDLEPSLVRAGRITPIGVPLPNEDERRDIWCAIITDSIRAIETNNPQNADYRAPIEGDGFTSESDSFRVYSPEINLLELALKTDGMTGADFTEILGRARQQRFAHYIQTGNLTQVTHDDILHVIGRYGR